jgi:hypothetical protein
LLSTTKTPMTTTTTSAPADERRVEKQKLRLTSAAEIREKYGDAEWYDIPDDPDDGIGVVVNVDPATSRSACTRPSSRWGRNRTEGSHFLCAH